MEMIRCDHQLHVWTATAVVWLAVVSRVAAQPFVGAALQVSWQPDKSPYVGTNNPSVPAQGIHGVAAGWFARTGARPLDNGRYLGTRPCR
jgi:hypothetical protein